MMVLQIIVVPPTLSVSPSTVDCSNIGSITVTLTATDAEGLTHSCSTTIGVTDPNANCCQPQSSEICEDDALTFTVGDAGLNMDFLAVHGPSVVTDFLADAQAGAPTINFIVDDSGCTNWGGNNLAAFFTFTVDTDGSYSFSNDDWDTGNSGTFRVMNIYETSYDSNNPCTNWLASNRFATTIGSQVSATLSTCNTYIMTVVHNSGGAAFNTNISLSGPGNITQDLGLNAGFAYTYIAVNTASGNIVAVDAGADFTSLAAGVYGIYGVDYQTVTQTPASWVGQALSGLEATGCLLVSTNNRSVTVETTCSLSIDNIAVTNEICDQNNSGTLTITASCASCANGTADIQYSVDGNSFQNSNVFNNLSTGTHTVVVRDVNDPINCQASTTSPAIGPNFGLVSATLLAVDDCNTTNDFEGSIEVVVEGGTPPYTFTYNWNQGNETSFQSSNTTEVINGIEGGGYSGIVVEDANGCRVPESHSEGVLVFNSPAFEFTKTHPTCPANNDGSFTFTITIGTTGPYEYSVDGGTTWSTNAIISGLSEGSYNPQVRDAAGCTSPFFAFENEQLSMVRPSASFNTVADDCTTGTADGSILVGASGGAGAPYQYSIDNGATFSAVSSFTGIASGTYLVIVQDANGCQSLPETVFVDGASFSFTASGTNGTCANPASFDFTVTGSPTMPLTYSTDGGQTFSATHPAEVVNGEYFLAVQDANGCIVYNNQPQSVSGPQDLRPTRRIFDCTTQNNPCLIIAQHDIVPGDGTHTASTADGTDLGDVPFGDRQHLHMEFFNDGGQALTINSVTSSNPYFEIDGNFPTTMNGGGFGSMQFEIIFGEDNNNNPAPLNTTQTTTITVNSTDCDLPTYVFEMSANVVCGVGILNFDGLVFSACPGEEIPFSQALFGGSNVNPVWPLTITYEDEFNNEFTYLITLEDLQTGPPPLQTGPGFTYTMTSASDQGTCPLTANGSFSLDGTGLNCCDLFITDVTTTGETCLGVSDGTITVTTTCTSCTSVEYSIDGTNFQSSSTFAGVAPGSYVVTAQDTGNPSGCVRTSSNNAVAAGTDTTSPTAVCVASLPDIALGAGGMTTIDPMSVDDGSSDNCITPTLSVSPAVIDCSNIGNVTITLTATDGAGLTNTCTVSVLVTDPNFECCDISIDDLFPLEEICPGDNLGGILATVSCNSCTAIEYSLDGTSFASNNGQFDGLGAGTYTVTVRDSGDPTCTASQIVTIDPVADEIAPNAQCISTLMVPLNGQGTQSLTPEGIDNGSVDDCDITPSLGISHTSFSCSDIGSTIVVTLTVTDASNNSSSCTTNVTVEDNMTPQALCQDYTIDLEGAGNATVTAADINNSSSDNCGVPSISITAGTTAYTCADIGSTFTVTLTADDGNGQTATCDADVTVADGNGACCSIAVTNVAVTDEICPGDNDGTITVTATCGSCANGTSDIEYSIDGSTFQASNVFNSVAVGAYTVTVRDANNNSCTDSGSGTVAAGVDSAAPMANCQDVIVTLDGDGNGTLAAGAVNNGSTDDCDANPSLSLSETSFDCSDIGGVGANYGLDFDFDGTAKFVELPISSVFNVGTGDFCIESWVNTAVTGRRVFFHTSGIWIATENGTIITSLNCQTGNHSVTNGAWHHIAVCRNNGTVEIIIDGVSAQTCNGNSSDINPNIQAARIGGFSGFYFDGVVDEVRFWNTARTVAEIQANMNTTLFGSEAGLVAYYPLEDGPGSSIASDIIASNDGIFNVGMDPATNWVSGASSISGGGNSVTLTVTDASGNSSTCTSNVTIEDITVPVIACPTNQAVDFSASCNYALLDYTGMTTSLSDNCGVAVVTQSPDQGVAITSTQTVTLTAIDALGNFADCTFDVIPSDNTDPDAACQSFTANLEVGGNATVAAGDIDNGSSDNCGAPSLSITAGTTSYTCSDIGSSFTVTPYSRRWKWTNKYL